MDLKEKLQNLVASENLVFELIENSYFGAYFYFDISDGNLYCSKNLEKLFNYNNYKNLHSLISPNSVNEFELNIKAIEIGVYKLVSTLIAQNHDNSYQAELEIYRQDENSYFAAIKNIYQFTDSIISKYNKIKNLLSSAGDLIIVFNQDLVVIEYHAQEDLILFGGMTIHIDKSFNELEFPKDVIQLIQNLIEQSQIDKIANGIFHLDHNSKSNWYSVRVTYDYYEKKYYVIIKDATEEITKDIENINKEKELDSIFNSANDGILIADAETGILVDANQRALDLFGYEYNEFIGLHQSKLHPEEDLEFVVNKFKEFAQTKEFTLLDTRIITKNKVIKDVEISASSPYTINGKTYISGFFRDITQRKWLKRNLINTINRLENIFNSIQEGHVLHTSEGQVFEINKAARKILGFKEEIDSQAINIKRDLFDNKPIYDQLVSKIINEGIKDETFEIKHQEDHFLIASVSAISYKDDNQQDMIDVTFRDVTNEYSANKLINSTLEIYEHYENKSYDQLIQFGLDTCENLTNSNIAFFHLVNSDQQTIKLTQWSTNTKVLCEVPELQTHYPIKQAGIWVECITKRQPIVHNDYSKVENKGGLPHGHVELIRDLEVPIIENGLVVAIIGVGNKETIYTEIDIRQLQAFGSAFYSLLQRKKSDVELNYQKNLLDEAQKVNKMGSWNFDLINGVLTWTDNLYNVFGTDKATFQENHKSFLEFVDEVDRDRVLNTSKNTQVTGEPFVVEYNITTNSGEKRIIKEFGYAEQDRKGQVIRLYGTAQDITSIKLVENKLKESEEQLGLILSNISEVIWVYNYSKNKYTYISPSVINLRGLSVDEAMNESLEDSLTAKSIAELKKVLPQSIIDFVEKTSTSSVKTIVLEQYRKDGSTFWVEFNIKLQEKVDGELEILGVSRNVSNRVKAELELKNSKEELELFFNNSLDGFFFMMLDEPIIWDNTVDKVLVLDHIFKSAKITKVNEALAKQYAAKREDFLGRTLQEFFIDDIEYGKNILRQALEKGFLRVETLEKDINGNEIWIDGNYICLFDESGRFKGNFTVQRDITERKNREMELRTVNNRYDEIAISSRTITWEVDANGLYTYVNEVIEKVLGYRADEVINKFHFYDLHPIEGREEFKKAVFEVFSRQESFERVNNQVISKDGTIYWMETDAIPLINSNGTLVGYRGTDHDITERKVYELELAKLNQEHEEIRTALDESSLVSVADKKGKILFVNQQFCNVSKYTEEELLGKDHHIVNSGYHGREFWLNMWKTISSGNVWKGEVQNRAKDGSYYWVSSVIYPIKDVKGNILKYISIRQDITSKKESELELVKRDLLLRELGENVPGGIFQFKVDRYGAYSFPYVSDGFAEIFEQSVDEVMADYTSIFSKVFKDDYDNFINSVVNSISNLTDWSLEFRILTANGNLRWLRGKATYNDSITDAIFYYGYIIDVTEDKYQELELERLAYVASNTHDLVVITDPEGFTEWINDSYTRRTGYTLEEMRGRKPGDVLQGPNTNKETKKKIRQAIDKLEPISARILNYNKNGEEYWINLSINPVFDTEGTLRYFIAIERDISELVNYEESLLNINKNLEKMVDERTEELRFANENLIKINSEKDRFLGMASHDLKNPLTSIMLVAELLESKLKRNHPEVYQDLKKSIETISHTSFRMNEIINEFLDVNRLQSGNFKLNKQEINLEEVLENAIKTLTSKANAKGIELALDIDYKQQVFVDRMSIIQITDNLVSNAIKFSNSGTKIDFSCKRISDQMIIKVKDQGQGIKKSELSKLYQPYTKLNAKPTAGEGSTGLGLSIVKYLVDLNEGDIECVSEIGIGTTFTVTLPL